jgi:type I restriction enzyme S subunit
MPNISKTNLKTAQLPVPPIELQNQFATIVEKVEMLKSRYQQSLSDLESLYGAISQLAFKGELDLSRVRLPNAQPDANVTEPTEQVEVPAEEQLAINLPDTDYLLDALTDSSLRERLLNDWLESYYQQIGKTNFSADDFLVAAQMRIAELHPDTEVELGAGDFGMVKDWVFKALESGRLKQERNQVYCVVETKETVLGNLIELKTGEQI